jgi:hypothetical protein
MRSGLLSRCQTRLKTSPASRRWGNYIEDLFDGDPVGEISRILRLPGTVNHPNKSKRDAGQTAAVAAILHQGNAVYKLEELEAAWPISTEQGRTPKSRALAVGSPTDPLFEPLEESSLVADDDYDDFAAGLEDTDLADCRYYGLEIASIPDGPFSSRTRWINPTTGERTKFSWLDWLFVMRGLADDYPRKEAEFKAVYDKVNKAAGGRDDDNEEQWDAQAGRSIRRRAAGHPVTMMGTLKRIAGIVEPLIPVAPTGLGLFEGLVGGPGATTIGSQPAKEPLEDHTADNPQNPDDPSLDATGDDEGFSAVLKPQRKIPHDPRPRLSVRTVIDVTKNPPPRPWALGNICLYGSVTTLASPGGVGKTALGIVLVLEGASGLNLIGHHVFRKAQKVLFVTQEEPANEIERRLAAAMRHYQIAQPCFGNILFYAFDGSKEAEHDPTERIELVSMKDGVVVVNEKGVEKLEMLIYDFNPRIVILDPLNSLLAAGLNDNMVITQLLLRLSRLHALKPVSVIIMHHTRKGADLESAEAAMGAYAISNTGRTTLNLQTLTGEEAKNLGILPSRASNYFRIIQAKANYIERRDDEDIYQLISVNLGNPTKDYPAGDNVKVVVKFDPANVPRPVADPSRDLIALRLIHGAPAKRLLGLSKTGPADQPSRNVHKHLRGALRKAGIIIRMKDVGYEMEQTIEGLRQRGLIEEVKFKDVGSHKRNGLKLTESGIKHLNLMQIRMGKRCDE